MDAAAKLNNAASSSGVHVEEGLPGYAGLAMIPNGAGATAYTTAAD